MFATCVVLVVCMCVCLCVVLGSSSCCVVFFSSSTFSFSLVGRITLVFVGMYRAAGFPEVWETVHFAFLLRTL